MKFPFKNVIFDGGAVIELLLSGDESHLYKNIIEGKIIPSTTILAVIEAEYILCRKLGKDKSIEKIDNLINSNYIEIFPLESLFRSISTLKCNNPIALPDCATIALATNKNISALFAKKEDELIKQLEKKKFKIKIYFLEDLLNPS